MISFVRRSPWAVVAGELVVAAATWGAYAAASSAVTYEGERYMFHLHFGMGEGDARVTPEQMAAFIDTEVTPRFPKGMSIHAVSGQWQSPDDGRIVRERSTIVAIDHPDTPENAALRQAVIDTYLTRYIAANVSIYVVRSGPIRGTLHYMPKTPDA